MDQPTKEKPGTDQTQPAKGSDKPPTKGRRGRVAKAKVLDALPGEESDTTDVADLASVATEDGKTDPAQQFAQLLSDNLAGIFTDLSAEKQEALNSTLTQAQEQFVEAVQTYADDHPGFCKRAANIAAGFAIATTSVAIGSITGRDGGVASGAQLYGILEQARKSAVDNEEITLKAMITDTVTAVVVVASGGSLGKITGKVAKEVINKATSMVIDTAIKDAAKEAVDTALSGGTSISGAPAPDKAITNAVIKAYTSAATMTQEQSAKYLPQQLSETLEKSLSKKFGQEAAEKMAPELANKIISAFGKPGLEAVAIIEEEAAETAVAITEEAETDVAITEAAETDVAVTEAAETEVAITEETETDVAITEEAETDVDITEAAETDVDISEATETDVAPSSTSQAQPDEVARKPTYDRRFHLPQESPFAEATSWQRIFKLGDRYVKLHLDEQIPLGRHLFGIRDASVSRAHAIIGSDEQGIYITENPAAPSTNGTFVSGVPVTPGVRAYFGPGDEVRLGRSRLQFAPADDLMEMPWGYRPSPAGIEQSNQYAAQNKIDHPIEDGFQNAGQNQTFDDSGAPSADVVRAITLVDRNQDLVLQDVIADVTQKFAKLDQRMQARALLRYTNALLKPGNISQSQLDNWYHEFNSIFAGKQILLGDFIRHGRGVSSQRALLYKVLADELGLRVSLLRGAGSEAKLNHGRNTVTFDDASLIEIDHENVPPQEYRAKPGISVKGGVVIIDVTWMTEANRRRQMASKPFVLPDCHEVSVGRLNFAEGDLREAVSRNHASLKYHGGILSIRDNGSLNGTWVNGNRLTAGEWLDVTISDTIRFGQAGPALNLSKLEEQINYAKPQPDSQAESGGAAEASLTKKDEGDASIESSANKKDGDDAAEDSLTKPVEGDAGAEPDASKSDGAASNKPSSRTADFSFISDELSRLGYTSMRGRVLNKIDEIDQAWSKFEERGLLSTLEEFDVRGANPVPVKVAYIAEGKFKLKNMEEVEGPAWLIKNKENAFELLHADDIGRKYGLSPERVKDLLKIVRLAQLPDSLCRDLERTLSHRRSVGSPLDDFMSLKEAQNWQEIQRASAEQPALVELARTVESMLRTRGPVTRTVFDAIFNGADPLQADTLPRSIRRVLEGFDGERAVGDSILIEDYELLDTLKQYNMSGRADALRQKMRERGKTAATVDNAISIFGLDKQNATTLSCVLNEESDASKADAAIAQLSEDALEHRLQAEKLLLIDLENLQQKHPTFAELPNIVRNRLTRPRSQPPFAIPGQDSDLARLLEFANREQTADFSQNVHYIPTRVDQNAGSFELLYAPRNGSPSGTYKFIQMPDGSYEQISPNERRFYRAESDATLVTKDNQTIAEGGYARLAIWNHDQTGEIISGEIHNYDGTTTTYEGLNRITQSGDLRMIEKADGAVIYEQKRSRSSQESDNSDIEEGWQHLNREQMKELFAINEILNDDGSVTETDMLDNKTTFYLPCENKDAASIVRTDRDGFESSLYGDGRYESSDPNGYEIKRSPDGQTDLVDPLGRQRWVSVPQSNKDKHADDDGASSDSEVMSLWSQSINELTSMDDGTACERIENLADQLTASNVSQAALADKFTELFTAAARLDDASQALVADKLSEVALNRNLRFEGSSAEEILARLKALTSSSDEDVASLAKLSYNRLIRYQSR